MKTEPIMLKIKYGTTLLLFFISFVTTLAQDFNLNIRNATVNFGSVKQETLVTDFELSYDKLKREWWKYVKRHALMDNMGTHHENKILAKTNQSATDIIFLSLVSDNNKNQPTLNISLKKDNLSDQNIQRYNQYLKDLMIDFKVGLYSSIMQKRIEDHEKKSKKVSSKIGKLERSNTKLESSKNKKNTNPETIAKKINVNNTMIEKLRVELFAHQKKIETLKNDLMKIK
ncbi:hypothetical protein [Reichenbachiella sp. MALMAid0571]|uniref:hypothetical protein n=1 Tax=Reichenbachiella sp. MALMAid0571 TaxID=3143939 RepID=UPI0032DFBEFD